ncbi:MAG: glycoside hydrolase family 65 protein [Planctomycetes bacterium]|nr:glycoside hydrolase family 65 protein [Planctomycetota bacterium]
MIHGGDDGWTLVEDGFRVEENRAIEGLFTLGSGYLHVRGSLEEHFDDDPQDVSFTRTPANVTSEVFRATKAKWGAYVPGVFGNHPTLGNELIHLPCFVTILPCVDGGRIRADLSEYRVFRRTLHLDIATLRREVELANFDGTPVRICFERFVSAARPHLCVQRVSLEVQPGRLVHVQAGIDADVRTNGFDHLADVRFERTAEKALRCDLDTDGGTHVRIATELRAAGAFSLDTSGRRASLITQARSETSPLTLEKRTAVTTSRDLPNRDAGDFLTDAADLTFDQLHAEHAAVWRQRWQDCDVEIEGDADSQIAIRTAIYHLLRCHVDDPRVAIDGKGYSGDAYWGRFFWDTEMLLLPFYLYSDPRKARTLADFRVQSLPGAMRNAKRYGYAGARYAWESDAAGDECCPNWQYADHEVHVTADVAYGLAHCAAATSDADYLSGPAGNVLIETARYWVQRIDWTQAPESATRTPVLLGVMGPDEYTPISSNNAYTNRMVAFALDQAARTAERSPSRAFAVSAEEIAAWRDVAARLPIPRHPRRPELVLQCDEFLSLAEPDFDRRWKDRSRTFASQVSQERLYRSKCLKQADVLMLMALFPNEFSDQQVRAAWDYYLPYTTHDSSLSPGVHALIACRLGLLDEAWRFWRQACAIDLDTQHGGASEGVHIANCGAIWQMAIFGFAGLRSALQRDIPTLSPRLPQQCYGTERPRPGTSSPNPLTMYSTPSAPSTIPIRRVSTLMPVLPRNRPIGKASRNTIHAENPIVTISATNTAVCSMLRACSPHRMMVLIVPGPASIGVARGTIAMSSRDDASLSSSGVMRADLGRARTMSSAMSRNSTPPITRKLGTRIENSISRNPPNASEPSMTSVVAIAERRAARFRSAAVQVLVSDRNNGAAPIGFRATNSVRSCLSVTASSGISFAHRLRSRAG